MSRQSKSVLTGVVLAVGVLVFMPQIYVGIARKFGKLAEIQNVGG